MSNTRSPSLRTIILIRIVPAAFALLILISFVVVRKVNSEISNQIQEQVNNRSEGIQLAVQTKLRQAIDACAAIANNHIVVNTFVNSENRSSDLLPFIRSLDFPELQSTTLQYWTIREHRLLRSCRMTPVSKC